MSENCLVAWGKPTHIGTVTRIIWYLHPWAESPAYLSWILGHPAGVWELLGGVGKTHTHRNCNENHLIPSPLGWVSCLPDLSLATRIPVKPATCRLDLGWLSRMGTSHTMPESLQSLPEPMVMATFCPICMGWWAWPYAVQLAPNKRGFILGWTVPPPNSYVEVVTSSTSEHNRNWW